MRALRRARRMPAISRWCRSRARSRPAWSNGRRKRKVGFSAVVSLGDQVDVDLGDCLDYFALDRATRAILLYVESVSDARKFMSAARAAARAKPVVVVKSGRHAQGARAAATHTGALAGSDEVYDAAFRRAGLLRVRGLDELFAAAETLGRIKPFPGKRLAILTNGGGVGVLAVDRLIDLGGTLADISPDTLARLDRRDAADLVARQSGRHRGRCRCSALCGGARGAAGRSGERRGSGDERADRARLADRRGAVGRPRRAETSKARRTQADPRGLDRRGRRRLGRLRGRRHSALRRRIRCGRRLHASRALSRGAGRLDGDSAEPAGEFRARCGERATRRAGRACGPARPGSIRSRSLQLLSAYAIPVAPVALARDPDEAAVAAAPLLAEGGTVVVKILSPDIVHKSEVGGVRLNLTSAQAVADATADILARARAAKPDARITGVTIHPMILRPKARELIAGIADDPTFGPVIVFGAGGTAVEVISDKALALPPLDLRLAQELIARTRIARVLKAYRDVPAADEGRRRARAGQARAAGGRSSRRSASSISIRCSPTRTASSRSMPGSRSGRSMRRSAARAAIRALPCGPIRRNGNGRSRCATAARSSCVRSARRTRRCTRDFFAGVTDEDLRLRFFAPGQEFSHTFIARFTQIDYARAMAFIAIERVERRDARRRAPARQRDLRQRRIRDPGALRPEGARTWLAADADDHRVRAQPRDCATIEGQVLRENTTMLAMCRELGFSVQVGSGRRQHLYRQAADVRPLRGPARPRPEAGRSADRRAHRWPAPADSARSRSRCRLGARCRRTPCRPARVRLATETICRSSHSRR